MKISLWTPWLPPGPDISDKLGRSGCVPLIEHGLQPLAHRPTQHCRYEGTAATCRPRPSRPFQQRRVLPETICDAGRSVMMSNGLGSAWTPSRRPGACTRSITPSEATPLRDTAPQRRPPCRWAPAALDFRPASTLQTATRDLWAGYRKHPPEGFRCPAPTHSRRASPTPTRLRT
jgi:hypothetical protein